MVLLLVGRLIFGNFGGNFGGEFAHAMPDDSQAASPNSAAQVQAHEPCPDHSSKAVEVMQTADSDDPAVAAHQGASHDTDCCKTAGCQSLCAHIAVVAMHSFDLNVVLRDHSGSPVAADGLMQDRLSELFRPPA